MIGQWLSLEYKINWITTHQRIRCQGHVINLIVQAFLFGSKKDEKLMDLYDKEDEEQDEEEEDVVQQAPPLVKRKDKKKKKDEELEPTSDEKHERGKSIRNIMGPMGKLHNYVVHIHTSANHMTWFIEHAGKMIPLDNCTRWNSWVLMSCVYIEVKF